MIDSHHFNLEGKRYVKTKLLLCSLPLVLMVAVSLPAQQDNSNTAPARSVITLANIHTIYVAPMPNGFDQYLSAELLKRLPKGVTLVENKSRADAMIEGIDQNSSHGISRTVNQVFGVGGGSSGAVRLLSRNGQILWATEKSDHTIPLYGSWREHGMPKVASRIAKNLANALRKAEKHAEKEAKKR